MEALDQEKNALLNLIKHQLDIAKIHLYAKDTYEAKYQFLINKCENVDLKHYNDPKAFLEYSNDIQDVYKNIEEHNKEKRSVIKLNPTVTELLQAKN